jgi:hypothetical protein
MLKRLEIGLALLLLTYLLLLVAALEVFWVVVALVVTENLLTKPLH